MNKLTKGHPVEVNVDLGHALGKHWLKGYVFEAYEPPFDTCLVSNISGFSAGVPVRYRLSDVREVTP
jgi:hypothetical protein